jgi:hypothetical protein
MTDKSRLRTNIEFAHFVLQTLIAPWPPYAVVLVITGAIGGLIPLVQIRVISGLINALTDRKAARAGLDERPLTLLLSSGT